MPKSNKSINKDLYQLLKSRDLDVTMKYSNGDDAPIPEEADVFEFDFYHNGENHGTVTITIDGLHDLIVYFNETVSKGADEQAGWVQFVKQLKKFSIGHQLGFKLSDMDKLNNDMKFREHNKKLDEGYYGTRHTSYSDNGPPSIKMIIKHNRPISETDARYRSIERIFLETEQGERVLVPSTKPSVGRIFARHLAEGGRYNDQRWQHITEMVEDVRQLSGFVRATRNRQFNESVVRLVNEATAQYQTLRENLKRLQSRRGYVHYFESWSPTLMEDSGEDLTELFMNSSLDPRIESALPVLNRLNIKITETSESAMFEDWANEILDEALRPTQPEQRDDLVELLGPDSEYMALGANADSAIGQLQGVLQDDDLNQRLVNAASRNPNRDARPIIIGWMSEQSGEDYNEILRAVDPDSKVDADAVKPEPKKEPEQQPENNTSDELPDLPDLPPIKEDSKYIDSNISASKHSTQVNESLERIKRLSGL
jgi:hypothetical protein